MKNIYFIKTVCSFFAISLSVAMLFCSGCKSVGLSPELPESPKIDGIRILEKVVYHKIDKNNDNKYEGLSAEIRIQIIKEGFYTITGVLEKDSKVIANQPAFEYSMKTSQIVGNKPGIHRVILVFSGEEILRSKKNGPYKVTVVALDQHSFAMRRFATPAYDSDSFGEY